MIAENEIYVWRRHIQKAFDEVRDGDCKSKTYSIHLDNYEYLQNVYRNKFGETYKVWEAGEPRTLATFATMKIKRVKKK